MYEACFSFHIIMRVYSWSLLLFGGEGGWVTGHESSN